MNIFDRFLNQNKINFIDEFINSENKKEFITMNIHSFNKLSGEELKQLLLNENIDYDIKHYILRTYSKQVKKISNNDFHLIIHLLHSKIDMYEYNDKLNTLNYNEYCNCLENIKSGESLIAAVDTTRFLQLLKEEKLGKNDLKNYLTLKDMYVASEYNNDLEEFKNQSNNLSCYLNTISSEKINIDLIGEIFFKYFNEKFKKFELNDSVYKCAFALMDYKIKNKLELDSNMLEFYVRYRIKDLKLDDIVKNVIMVEKYDRDCFGFFDSKSQEIKINSSYIKEKYIKALEIMNMKFEECINIINHENLLAICHEIGHVYEFKNLSNKNVSNEGCKLFADDYSIRSKILHFSIGHDAYSNNHDRFIGENRADLFSIIDDSIQINKHFNDSFGDEFLISTMRSNARKIIEMYTIDQGDRKLIKSPIQKFEKFFKENFKDIHKQEKMEISEDISIIEKLLSGYPIPIEILMKINSVATGEIETTNLYETILEFIKEYESNLELEERQRKI